MQRINPYTEEDMEDVTHIDPGTAVLYVEQLLGYRGWERYREEEDGEVWLRKTGNHQEPGIFDYTPRELR